MIKQTSAALTAILLVACDTGSDLVENPDEAYSHGYRFGVLLKASAKGTFKESGEGFMSLGYGGVARYDYSQDQEGNLIKRGSNPWYFSYEAKDQVPMQRLLGRMVVVEYVQSNMKLRGMDTSYMAREIAEWRAPVEVAPDCEHNEPVRDGFSRGVRVGRVVKVSYKGAFTKAYTITMQNGFSGNMFHAMTLPDERMYNCALAKLQSGLPVSIHYDQAHTAPLLSGPANDYTVTAIDTLELDGLAAHWTISAPPAPAVAPEPVAEPEEVAEKRVD